LLDDEQHDTASAAGAGAGAAGEDEDAHKDDDATAVFGGAQHFESDTGGAQQPDVA
jgi:hypothetical protein